MLTTSGETALFRGEGRDGGSAGCTEAGRVEEEKAGEQETKEF